MRSRKPYLNLLDIHKNLHNKYCNFIQQISQISHTKKKSENNRKIYFIDTPSKYNEYFPDFLILV